MNQKDGSRDSIVSAWQQSESEQLWNINADVNDHGKEDDWTEESENGGTEGSENSDRMNSSAGNHSRHEASQLFKSQLCSKSAFV